jgi:hypothetical protein
LLGVLLLGACGPATPIRAADSSPTPAIFDLTGWTTSVHGVGPEASENNGRLELTMPWSTHNDQSPNDLSVHVIAPCQLSGDFDVSVRYTLITWPVTSGVWVGLGAGDYAAARVSHRNGPDNRYATYMAGTVTEVDTRDRTGSLRLTRVGTAITGYYKDPTSGWMQIGSANVASKELPYEIEAWSDASFGRRTVVAAFNSLTLSGTKVNCS